jgi:hypothetical protein
MKKGKAVNKTGKTWFLEEKNDWQQQINLMVL